VATKQKNNAKYTKFLSKMFPSKYIDKKLNAQDSQCPNNKQCIKKEDSKTVVKKEKECDKEKEKDKPSTPNNVNIFFTVDEVDDDDDWEDEEDSDYASDEEDSDDEDEDVSVSSEESTTDDDEEDDDTGCSSVSNETPTINSQVLDNLLELKSANKSGKPDKILDECIDACKKKIKEITKKQCKKNVKQKEKNQRIFKKMLSVKKLTNELVFFKKMPMTEQKILIKEMREINKVICIEKPYRLSLLESPIPILHKSIAMKRINLLKSMDEYCSEYYKIKHWVDTFMRIPFGKYNSLEITMQDGVESSNMFMETAKQTLDTAVYGLNDAKMQIMQLLGQLITNPDAIGCAVAIKGPPGTGKTSLVKEGISKILNRPFAFIALGGATDSSFLEGHSYTYEGSTWGKIVQILIDSKCMNPVIYFDELDKISGTPKGDEIVGILTHLTDSSQNGQFHDKYFSEIDFDLSKCLFIFSYNDESKISPILRDRMYRIQTKGYDKKQKTIIATHYLLPKIQEQVRFNKGDICISDEVLHYIIEHYCEKEDGVRNQKRCLEIIYTKLNLYRLMRPGSSLFDADMTMEVSFPFQVTKQIVDKLIKLNKEDNFAKSMYV
jgi:ATP-dependent Lon protease